MKYLLLIFQFFKYKNANLFMNKLVDKESYIKSLYMNKYQIFNWVHDII